MSSSVVCFGDVGLYATDRRDDAKDRRGHVACITLSEAFTPVLPDAL